jgi:hypothetical protein
LFTKSNAHHGEIEARNLKFEIRKLEGGWLRLQPGGRGAREILAIGAITIDPRLAAGPEARAEGFVVPLMFTETGERANIQNEIEPAKTGPGTVVRSALRAVPATDGDPVLKQGMLLEN